MGRPDLRAASACYAGAAVLVLDQVTKTLFSAGRAAAPVAVIPVRNDRAMLGVVGGGRTFLSLAMAALLVGFGIHLVRLVRGGRLAGWAAGLLIGGAAGNLVDRVLSGSVRDFLVVGNVVCNLADLAVLVGLVAFAVARKRPPVPVLTREEVTT
jgi:signal peptidase II